MSRNRLPSESCRGAGGLGPCPSCVRWRHCPRLAEGSPEPPAAPQHGRAAADGQKRALPTGGEQSLNQLAQPEVALCPAPPGAPLSRGTRALAPSPALRPHQGPWGSGVTASAWLSVLPLLTSPRTLPHPGSEVCAAPSHLCSPRGAVPGRAWSLGGSHPGGGATLTWSSSPLERG